MQGVGGDCLYGFLLRCDIKDRQSVADQKRAAKFSFRQWVPLDHELRSKSHQSPAGLSHCPMSQVLRCGRCDSRQNSQRPAPL